MGIASWAPNCTVGVALNLEDGTMEFLFDGKSTGIAFNGFASGKEGDSNQGFYPAISLNQNTSCTVNLGAKPFKFKPSGYIGFESAKYCSTSSWLSRYSMASDVTYYLSNGLNLPTQIVDQCLANEVALDYGQEMRFEIAKCNAMTTPSMDYIFKDDTSLFNSTQPSGTTLCFKVSGFEPAEFVLTGITVRCSTVSNGFKVMAFISTKETEPDLDQYSWCGHWSEQQYSQWAKGRRTMRKPHEPIGFVATKGI